MATRKNPLKGLFKVTAKGRAYYYAWRNGPRIEAEFGTDEFLAEYLALRSPMGNINKQRIAAWVTLYRDSDYWRKDVSEKTKRTWAPLLDSIQAHFGALPVRLFDRPMIRTDIKHWRAKWKDTPRMADMAKQVLSRVCSFMVEEGVLSVNPCAGIPNLYSSDRSQIIWTQADMDAIARVASPEITWAMKLAAFTGLRQGDLLKLTWAKIDHLAIETRTSKSEFKRRAQIPLYPALREVLAAIPKRGLTVLTSSHGAPWKSFGSSWKKAFKRSGLKDSGLHFHDLRGTAATNFYRAGLTSREIADIMAWEQSDVEAMLDIYVKRDELLIDRIRRMEQHENENRKTDSKTGSAKVG